MNMDDPTMFLFARPSLLEGMARVVDLGGTLNEYNFSLDESQADRLALKADMAALRVDIAAAREILRSEIMHASRQTQRPIVDTEISDCNRR